MQIKTTKRNTPTKMTKIQNLILSIVGEDAELQKLSFFTNGNAE